MSVSKEPHLEEHFGCVQAVWAYFLAQPGVRQTLALSSHGSSAQWSDLRRLCFLVATKNNLDPRRFVPHSFRSGALAQCNLLRTSASASRADGYPSMVFGRTCAMRCSLHTR
jgi:hypothetical protein